MQIHQIIKNTIKAHKSKIELIQWAIVNGVASLVYSEYIRNIRQRNVPVRTILVPEIRKVEEFLNPDNGGFMELLSDDLIDKIANHELIKKYSNAPELVLFNEEKIEVMKTIFDLYTSPIIISKIPEVISNKFGLRDPNRQSIQKTALIREDRDITLFHNFIDPDHFRFIVNQTVLQLLVMMPTLKKTIEIPEDNGRIEMTKSEILTIGNENAICPIQFDESIISDLSVIKLLSFVTSTNFRRIDTGEVGCQKNNEIVRYLVDTNPFNKVALIKLGEVEPIEEKE